MANPLKIGVQMDHVSGIDILGDSTFAMCLEAQARGHELFHFTPFDLRMTAQSVSARLQPMQVRDVKGDHFTLEAPQTVDLAEMDVILLRQDPPFDMSYITNTHMLERIHKADGSGTLVVNDPASVRNAPEKLLVMEYPDLMPATLITRDRSAIDSFRAEHGDIIIKPLYGNGGAGVFLLRHDDQNLSSLMEMFGAANREPLIAQAYLPAVRAGDKRILLIDGEPVGAINRVPPEGDARSNMHIGGVAEPVDLTDSDRAICDAIKPALVERGFILVGIDVIGDKMTEINVSSPSGLREVKAWGVEDIASLFWDAVERRLVRQ
ncbi:MAG: glutathione synthase [Pseudomonadota bacterium]